MLLLLRGGSNPPEGELSEDGGYKPAPVSGVQAKVAVQRTATFQPSFLALERLAHYVAPRYTERTEGCPEQHYRGTTVRNTRGGTWAKERPPGKAVILPGQ